MTYLLLHHEVQREVPTKSVREIESVHADNVLGAPKGVQPLFDEACIANEDTARPSCFLP